MNIFWLDEDLELCAQYHCDKHVVKMILETVQILSTALFKAGVENVPYKPTHRNHPCVIWAGESNANFKKLCLLGTKLSIEYTYRYGKVHKSSEALKEILKLTDMNQELPFGNTPETTPPLCMPNSDDDLSVVENYRNYYQEKLDTFGMMCYTDRDIPDFLE